MLRGEGRFSAIVEDASSADMIVNWVQTQIWMDNNLKRTSYIRALPGPILPTVWLPFGKHIGVVGAIRIWVITTGSKSGLQELTNGWFPIRRFSQRHSCRQLHHSHSFSSHIRNDTKSTVALSYPRTLISALGSGTLF
jgi:hypothetical protein